MTWLALGTRINQAKRRGAKLVVIDLARVGLAAKADEWLRVRPGSDGALALSLAHVMISEELYDKTFVRDWTNGPFRVRGDNGEFVTEADVISGGDAELRLVWDSNSNDIATYVS